MPRKISKYSIASSYLGLHQVNGTVLSCPYRSSQEKPIALRLGCQRSWALKDGQHLGIDQFEAEKGLGRWSSKKHNKTPKPV